MSPDSAIQSELNSYLSQLGTEDQARVIELARALANGTGSTEKKQLRGTPGKELLQFVGTIPPEDLDIMERVIEEECERINPRGW